MTGINSKERYLGCIIVDSVSEDFVTLNVIILLIDRSSIERVSAYGWQPGCCWYSSKARPQII